MSKFYPEYLRARIEPVEPKAPAPVVGDLVRAVEDLDCAIESLKHVAATLEAETDDGERALARVRLCEDHEFTQAMEWLWSATNALVKAECPDLMDDDDPFWPAYHWYVEAEKWSRGGFARTAARATERIEAVLRERGAEDVEHIGLQRQLAESHEPALIRWSRE